MHNAVVVQHPKLIAALRAVLPAGALLVEPEDTQPWECDGLTLIRQRPMAVVLPDTEEQVVQVLQLCHAHGVPVVPRGAGEFLDFEVGWEDGGGGGGENKP